MLATKVACPHCQAVLKSAQPLAADRALTCLRCGTVFTASGTILPPSAGAGRQPSLRGAAPVAAPFQPPPLQGAPRAALLAALLGGLLLFVGGGVALAIYCLSGEDGTTPGDVAAGEDGGVEVVVTSVSPADRGTVVPPTRPVTPAKGAGAEPLPGEANPPAVNPDARPPEPKGPPALVAVPPPGKGVLTAQQKQINEAIDRGVKFLKASQLKTGRWDTGPNGVGYAALPGLTLLECGVPANDPAVQRAAKYVRLYAKGLESPKTTYELSLAILFLDRLGDSRDRELIQTMALRLIAGQNATGGWTYKPLPYLSPADQKHLLAFLRRHQKESMMDPLGTASAGGSNPLGTSPGGSLQDPLSGSNGQLPNPLPKPAGPQAGDPLQNPVYSPQPGLLPPIDPGESAKIGQPAPTEKDNTTPGKARPVETPRKPAKGVAKLPKPDPLPAHLKNLPVVHMNDGSVKPRLVLGKKGKANPKAILRGISGDNSNTQFAILALWVARRHGVPMERTLALIDHRFQSSQNPDGGWGYHYTGEKSVTKDTMTCVGLLGLAVGHGFAQETAAAMKKGKDTAPPGGQKEQDAAIQRGLKKLGEYVGNPKKRNARAGGPINLYLLWSIERVGVLYNLKTIGNKDWYEWAAQLLLPAQQAKGSWSTAGFHGSSPTIDTCLALLILKRANLVQDLTDNLQMLGITDPDARRASGR